MIRLFCTLVLLSGSVSLLHSQDIIVNGGFEEDIASSWELQLASGGSATVTADRTNPYSGAACARIDIQRWSSGAIVYLEQQNVPVKQGKVYTLTFHARAAAGGKTTIGCPGNLYARLRPVLTEDWQRYTMTYAVSATPLNQPILILALGAEKSTVWFDDISLIEGGTLWGESVRGSIDTSRRFQIMEGWGASQALTADKLHAIDAPLRDSLLDLFFTEKGAALSILRVQVDPRWDYTYWADTVDEDQYWLLREAQKRGVRDFFAVPWSPPDSMKSDGIATPDVPSGHLLPTHYEEYSKVLSRYLRGYETERGIGIRSFSFQNEPDGSLAVRSCPYNWQEAKDFLRVLVSRFRADGVRANLFVPECKNVANSRSMFQSIVADTLLAQAIAGVATHSNAQQLARDSGAFADAALQHGITRVWQSAFDPADELGDDLANALVCAARIHDDMTLSNLTAWLFPLLVAYDTYSNDGLVRMAFFNQRVSKRLWALAQYSRFVRAGARRVAVVNGDNPLQCTAFLSPTGDSLIVIAANSLAIEAPIAYAIPMRGSTEVTGFRTSPAGDMLPIVAFAARDSLICTLPAKSITTFLIPLRGSAVGVGDLLREEPEALSLSPNYPNPFGPGAGEGSTTISYSLPESGFVTLGVYDLLGRLVAMPLHEKASAGRHAVRFDAGDLPRGIYVYRLECNGGVRSRTMLVVK
jgi:glucosylceramidase